MKLIFNKKEIYSKKVGGGGGGGGCWSAGQVLHLNLLIQHFLVLVFFLII